MRAEGTAFASARRVWAAAAVLLALAGCRSGPPTVGDPPPKLQDANVEREYRDLLGRYSGTAEVYSGFDTQMFAGATYQTWTFREARVKRLALFQAMTEQEIAERMAAEKAEHDQFHVVEFGAWTVDPKFDDFDKKDSIWRIALVAEGMEILPSDVRRVTRVDQNVRAIYPYMGQFWVKYRAKFPRVKPDGSPAIPPGTREVMFRLASTLGKAEIRAAAE